MATISKAEVVTTTKRMRFNDPVRVQVGASNASKIYTVDAQVLTSRSLFFRKALSSGFKEAEERIVKLPEDNPELFGTYVHLLHTKELSVIPDPLPADYRGREEKTALAELYVLAEKLQDLKSKNIILQGLIARCYHLIPGCKGHEHIDWEVVAVIYTGTVAGSMARKFLTDMIAWDGDGVRMSELWPREFVSDVAYELMMYRAKNYIRKQCNWHPEAYLKKEEEA